jgi:hypothetical protein
LWVTVSLAARLVGGKIKKMAGVLRVQIPDARPGHTTPPCMYFATALYCGNMAVVSGTENPLRLEVPLQSEVRRTSKMTPTTITAEVQRTSPKKCDAFP